MAEAIDYRGYRFLVSPVGKGWRAMIFAPGSPSALPESPATLEKSLKEAIIVEAKRIVDARLKHKVEEAAAYQVIVLLSSIGVRALPRPPRSVCATLVVQSRSSIDRASGPF
jgi:hypothetical protein